MASGPEHSAPSLVSGMHSSVESFHTKQGNLMQLVAYILHTSTPPAAALAQSEAKL